MHLVLLNQYYPPDLAPTGVMLEALARRLAAEGHRVTVVCARGGYAGPATGDDHPGEAAVAGLTVRRIGALGGGRRGMAAKLGAYLGYSLGVAAVLLTLHPRPDRVVALTTPPLLSLLARALSKLRGADHAHWVMDLYPDVMVAHGMLAPAGLATRLLGGLTRWGFGGARCRAVITLGPDMQERVGRYLRDATPRRWVPLWSTAAGDHEHAPPADRMDESDHLRPLRLLYSGNMGLGHRFADFLEAALEAGPGFEWIFCGGGPRRREIEEFLRTHPQAPVRLADYVPRDALARHLASADIHLASLEPSWDGTMVPSKLQGIFASGRPVLLVGSRTSAMGRWVLESGAGWVVPPGDCSAIRTALKEAADVQIRLAKGRAALMFASTCFDQATNVSAVAATLAVNPAANRS